MGSSQATHTILRTGDAPFTFTGELLARAGGPPDDRRHRSYELAIYRSAAGSYVAVVHFATTWRGEMNHTAAYVGADSAAIVAALKQHQPTPPRIGFPPGPKHEHQNAMLRSDLAAQYAHAVGELLFKAQISADLPAPIEVAKRVDELQVKIMHSRAALALDDLLRIVAPRDLITGPREREIENIRDQLLGG